MRFLCALCLATFAAGAGAADEPPLSIANTQALEFAGKRYELKFQSKDEPVVLREYFLPAETTDKWSELMDFRIYPVTSASNDPLDHAARTAKLFKQQFPYMQFALSSNKESGAAVLDFLSPTSTREDGEFMEFNAFKFYKSAGTPNVISIHYAKNIDASDSRKPEDLLAEVKATRAEIVPAIAKFPLYKP